MELVSNVHWMVCILVIIFEKNRSSGLDRIGSKVDWYTVTIDKGTLETQIERCLHTEGVMAVCSFDHTLVMNY
jgi:hypothetical protein